MTERTVLITEVPLLGKDDRGMTLTLPNDRSGDYLLCYRKGGSISGRHYHTGKSAGKNPEIFYLLSGKIYFRWREIEDTQLNEAVVEAPARVEVPAKLWHELEAISDCSFLEMNSPEEGNRDTIK